MSNHQKWTIAEKELVKSSKLPIKVLARMLNRTPDMIKGVRYRMKHKPCCRTYSSILAVIRSYNEPINSFTIYQKFLEVNGYDVKRETIYISLYRATKDGILKRKKIKGRYYYQEKK